MALFLNGWRRRRLRDLPLPAEWEGIIERNVTFYACLSAAEQRELFGHTQILLTEKHFEGCDGLELTNEIRVTVAAYAAVLLLHRETDYYPGLTSILVYPSAYVASHKRHMGGGIWEEGDTARVGETALRLRAVVVDWDDVPRGSAAGGSNVVLHEFAHQLDFEDGVVDGTPLLAPNERKLWSTLMADEYEKLRTAVLAGAPTVIPVYGATNRAEFFAVLTEMFFHRGSDLRAAHPGLYAQLRAFYSQDPASWCESRGSRPAIQQTANS